MKLRRSSFSSIPSREVESYPENVAELSSIDPAVSYSELGNAGKIAAISHEGDHRMEGPVHDGAFRMSFLP
jgi:hypothetical protein